MSFPIYVYRKFTNEPKKYNYLSFIFCFSLVQMQTKFKMSKIRSVNQLKIQKKYMNIAFLTSIYFNVSFGLFILKLAYDNLKSTFKFDSLFIDTFIILVKIVFFILFLIAFNKVTLSTFVTFLEMILASRFLSNRLDDLTDQILNLFSNNQFMKKSLLNRKISNFSKDYNSLLITRSKIRKHFNKTLSFLNIILIFDIIYPALIIFEPDKKKLELVFYATNYVCINLMFGSIVYNNYKFLCSVSLIYFLNISISIYS